MKDYNSHVVHQCEKYMYIFHILLLSAILQIRYQKYHISSWDSTVNLTLEKITHKVITVCVLIMDHSMQTPTLIDIRNIARHNDYIRTRIPALLSL